MRVAIDGQCLTYGMESGLARYVASLVDALGAEFPADVWDLLGRARLAPRGVARDNVRWRPAPGARAPWFNVALPAALWRARPDVYLSPIEMLPAPVALRRRPPAVAVVHDLNRLIHPRWFGDDTNRRRRAMTLLSLRRANRIIAVSDYTRQDLARHIGVAGERVEVIHSAPSPVIRRLPRPAAHAAVRQQWGLERYILAVGSVEPKRNLGRLAAAAAAVNRARADQLRLVVVGSLRWPYRSIADALGDAASAGEVLHLQRVSDEQLCQLYNAASVVAYISQYEGFGLPVLEAMACGTPVVAANTTSIPEVAGDAALLVPPGDIAAIVAGLERALEPAAASRLACAGLVRAAEFTWQATAQATRAVLAAAAGAPSERSCA